MAIQPVLETERLILRPFQLSDADDAQVLVSDKLIASTTLNIPHPYPEGGAAEWIKTHESGFKEGKRVVYAVTLKDSGEIVGAISLANMVSGHQAELGYWVGVPCWNKGYCTEAGEALLRYGFTELGLNRIH